MGIAKLKSLVNSVPMLNAIARFVHMIYSISVNKCLKTLTFSPPGHFYSPLPNLKHVAENAGSIFHKATTLPAIELRSVQQLELLENFRQYGAGDALHERQSPSVRYYSDNPYFGDGDAVILFSLLRHFKPKQLIEVGSGFSSALILDINDEFFGNEIDLTFIEPFSERLLGLLSGNDKDKCRLIEEPVQQVSIEIFNALDSNDVLFIDSSHIVKVGSDVTHIILNILPALKPGVIVHFHDILWPFEYPEDWLMQGISWNEAYFLRAFLEYNQAFEILYFNSYIAECFPDQLTNCFSKPLKNTGGSIWLRKIS